MIIFNEHWINTFLLLKYTERTMNFLCKPGNLEKNLDHNGQVQGETWMKSAWAAGICVLSQIKLDIHFWKGLHLDNSLLTPRRFQSHWWFFKIHTVSMNWMFSLDLNGCLRKQFSHKMEWRLNVQHLQYWSVMRGITGIPRIRIKTREKFLFPNLPPNSCES